MLPEPPAVKGVSGASRSRLRGSDGVDARVSHSGRGLSGYTHCRIKVTEVGEHLRQLKALHVDFVIC